MTKAEVSRISKRAKRMAKKAKTKSGITVEDRLKDAKKVLLEKNGQQEQEQIDGTEKERQDAMHRAKMCMQEIQESQNKWHCRISPTLNQPEWVGNGSKMIISATYAVEPLPMD